MNFAIRYLRAWRKRQVVRPWALATPILVLLVALPLLRPLRSPGMRETSASELSRLAAIQSLAENHTQEINGSAFFQTLRSKSWPLQPAETVQLDGRFYSDKAPVLGVILAGAYMVFQRFGLSFRENQALVVYLLTIVGSVIPVAGAGGMIYRMGRLFELRRPWRTVLALAVTFGSGLISYAVVLNAHAPAAALVLGACACLVHITVVKEPTRTGAWLMICGLCASLAATIDLGAVIFLVGLVFVIVALRWRKRLRFAGVLLYLIGAIPPLLLHAVLTVPVTGDMLPPSLHPEMNPRGLKTIVDFPAANAIAAISSAADTQDDDGPADTGWLHAAVLNAEKVLGALIGSHGIFSHFPVLILGLMGTALVLRRHWPIATKTLAAVTLIGGATLVLAYVFMAPNWTQAMFGPRWCILFLPLLMYWSGAWLRKSHHPITWATAAMLLLFSIGVSLLGATAPFLSTPGRYSAAVALRQLIHPLPPPEQPPIVASRGD